MAWIEARPTFVIGAFVFGFCYLVATVILYVALMLSKCAVAQSLKTITPTTLTPLGVILGLVIGFLAARVWANLDRANQYVGQEAGALRETILLTDSLPADIRTGVRQAVQRHIDLIHSEEWPAMARGKATLESIAVGLAEAMTVLLSFTPAQSNQQLAQQRALVAIEQALEARRNRILLSQAEIAPIQWSVILVLAILVLVTIALVHIDRPLAIGVTLFIFSTAISICLVLLLVYDRPFGAGGFTVRPTVLRAVLPN
jgi:uncharacterized membrane-anchored protein YhcB (DUF1043 family)